MMKVIKLKSPVFHKGTGDKTYIILHRFGMQLLCPKYEFD